MKTLQVTDGGRDVALELCARLQQERPWSDFSVGEQIFRVLQGLLQLPNQPEGSSNSSLGPSVSLSVEKPEEGPVAVAHQGQQKQQPAVPSRFSDIVIPWGGLAGLTLFTREGSKASQWIRLLRAKGAVREVKLPLYGGQVATVHLDLSPPAEKNTLPAAFKTDL